VALLRVDESFKSSTTLIGRPPTERREVLSESSFKRTIAIERKRTERSGEPFLLMLLNAGNHQNTVKNQMVLDSIASALPSSIRETDVIGWYEDRNTLGMLFTGLTCTDKSSIVGVILSKISNALRTKLTTDQFSHVSISFHFFPDDWDPDNPERPTNSTLYPDLLSPNKDSTSSLRIKRLMDIGGSALMLVLCSPLLLAIAIAVKLSSRGPVLFRQQRVGQYGKCFTFLKFRSMRTGNDNTVHKDYVTQLIAGKIESGPANANGNGNGVYKLTNDKRVTRLGRFLRRTSLDELPQFINVMKGEMSLVGPRPAIPYELAAYQTWHRRRVLEVKPGITGLWQVSGRSRVKFDEMVRLDLRYATSWSPWLDLTILMQTPRAVLVGSGAC
jgi:lipopolysaccharide/colanic/teichoic acid biosynthesis glycosyltransferase